MDAVTGSIAVLMIAFIVWEFMSTKWTLANRKELAHMQQRVFNLEAENLEFRKQLEHLQSNPFIEEGLQLGELQRLHQQRA